MAKIELIVSGKQKFRELKNFETDYKKKIGSYISFEIHEIRTKKGNNEETTKEIEGNKILSRVKSTDRLIILHNEGDTLTSIQFSKFISDLTGTIPGKIFFAIGGPSGFSRRVHKNAFRKISFSKMTFPHDIFRVLFLEQLYRAFSIIRGQKYHR